MNQESIYTEKHDILALLAHRSLKSQQTKEKKIEQVNSKRKTL